VAFLDPSGDQLLVSASVDEQLCGLLLPGLVPGSLRKADRWARDLGPQVSAPRGQLSEAGQSLGFLRLGEGSASRVSRRGSR
jgi:hypothetical protein